VSDQADRPLIVFADWMDEGNCRGMDPEIFHPHKEDKRGLARAVAICHNCPVREPCLEHALDEGTRVRGIWAGTSDKERGYMRRNRKQAS
jgi:WhiB family redox-sensing transcriptional regulator